MRKVLTLLALGAALAGTATASAAHKPKTPVVSVTQLLVSPHSGKPNSLFTLTGRHFPANQKMPVQMFCPTWGKKTNGYDHWTVKSNSSGTFVQKHHALKPKNTHSTSCGIYVFVKSHGRAFYVSNEFRIKT